MTTHLHRLAAGFALLTAATGLSAASPAAADPPPHPSHYGQCVVLSIEWGINPGLSAPGRQDHEHYPGPAVIIYNADGSVRAVHWAQGFTFGGACTIPDFPHHEIEDIAASGPVGPSCANAGVGCPDTIAIYLSTTA